MSMRCPLSTVIFGLLLVAVSVQAEDAPAGKLSLATERIVIFKDGFALFVKNASATADNDGHVFTDNVPDGAVLGCFWATTDQKALGMRAEWVENKEERAEETSCTTILELLRVNKGKKLTLALTDKTSVTGVVADVLDLAPAKPKPNLARPAVPVWRGAEFGDAAVNPNDPHPAETVREIVPLGGQLVAVETEQGRSVLPIAEVRSLTGPDIVTKMVRKKEETTWKKKLSFDLGKEAAGKKAALKIIYFAEGVRWIPTYRISGALDEKADIALQGEILNEAEDFENTSVDLVVGVPNFRFKNTISPLSLEQTLRNTLAAAAPGLNSGNAYSNATFSQRAGEWQGRAAAGAAPINLAPELGKAGGQQDMFVYSAKTMSLKKGARATLPLWQSGVPVRHLYTMDVKMVRNPQHGASMKHRMFANQAPNAGDENDPVSPLRLAENPVWHQVELGNNGNVPWTTGAALIVKDNLPLGQELLTYTPPGTSTLLPITVAVDMCGSYQEEETGRQANALMQDGTSYTLIHKKATVTVTNQRKDSSLTRVSVSLGGKAEKISDDGKVQLNEFRTEDWQDWNYRTVNNHSDVTWEFTLDAGKTKTMTFEISMFVR